MQYYGQRAPVSYPIYVSSSIIYDQMLMDNGCVKYRYSGLLPYVVFILCATIAMFHLHLTMLSIESSAISMKTRSS